MQCKTAHHKIQRSHGLKQKKNNSAQPSIREQEMASVTSAPSALTHYVLKRLKCEKLNLPERKITVVTPTRRTSTRKWRNECKKPAKTDRIYFLSVAAVCFTMDGRK